MRPWEANSSLAAVSEVALASPYTKTHCYEEDQMRVNRHAET